MDVMLRSCVFALVLGGTGMLGDAVAEGAAKTPAAQSIAKLAAPREALSGEDATFAAILAPGAGGRVTFELKTYGGKTVWARTVPAADGRAAVVLKSAEAVELEKGSRVLVAAADGGPGHRAYAPVRLRGRLFRNVTQAPKDMRPGDEIVVSDTSLLEPSEAIARVSVKGKWWRRSYTVPGEDRERALVCVEEHDLDDPRSCLAPQLTLPLKLKGWYEVWVRTYRHRLGGGIDVRLSGEKCFLHADPLQIDTSPGGKHPPYGALVDVLYRAADLTGQHLVFQQPYGTYDSQHKLCSASLAGVRLVRLSDRQVAELQAERAREDKKIIGFDNDGFSYFFLWGVHDRACIARLLEPLRGQSPAFLNISLGGLGGITIPTPYTEMYQMTGHDRDGDLRANAFFRWCVENDVNIVRVLAERAREVGLKLFVSLMAERSFSRDKTMRAHPEWRVRRGRGTWDYANAGVQAYQVKKIAWICEHHDIDGFVLDFTRYGHFFNEDEPKKFEHMNAFVRRLRAAIDKVNAGKKRKVLLCGSFGDRSWHLTHWGSGKLGDQGLDVTTWLDEGIFDVLMPEGPTALDFVKMAKDKKSRTRVWPRKVSMVTFDTHKNAKAPLGPKEIEKGAKGWFDNGAPGIFFFNHKTWTALSRLGFSEELDLRTRVDEVYGYRGGPAVTFATWYPSIEERTAQRETLRPLVVAADSPQSVDGEVTVPIRNTFRHGVTAVVRWVFPEKAAGPRPAIAPAARTIGIAPGVEAAVSFRLKGRADGYASLPRASIELLEAGRPVFRHSLPLRAAPQMVCGRTPSPPRLDGEPGDPAWAGVGGLKPRSFSTVGRQGQPPGKVTMATAYDDKSLYVAVNYTGDVSHVKRTPPTRDARGVYQTDHVQFLIDPAGAELEYRAFVVTPAGGQADYRAHFYPFAGHFVAKRDWNAEWIARAALREDGYCIEAAIPFKALGATPRRGDVWRVNVSISAAGARGQRVTCSWSSGEAASHLPRALGTLFGTLRFE